MSDLPSSALDYGAVVSEYFLGLRGGGLMLSPLDEEIVADWERRGLPVAVVCRGLRRGLEQHAENGAGRKPRSLRALRLAVEDEWRAYRSGRVGDAPPPAGEDGRLRAARGGAGAPPGGATDGGARPARRLPRRLARAHAGRGGGVRPLARARRGARRGRPRASSPPGSRALAAARSGRRSAARVRLLAGPRPRGASRRAYRDALRAPPRSTPRAAAGLTCLRGSV